MKRSFKSAVLVVLLGIGGSTIFLGKKFITNLFSVAHYTLANDALLTKATHNQIITLLNTTLQQHHDQQIVITTIQQSVPGIAAINTLQSADGVLHIAIQAAKPVYIVNNSMVLTACNTLAPRSTYIPQATESLPAVNITLTDSPNVEHIAAIKHELDKLPTNLLTSHHLERVSETESWLRNNEQQNFALIFNDHVVMDEKKMNYARYLKNELEQQGKFSSRQASAWVVDFRFENQIILFAEKRGVSYG